jgi:hypothetical protein
LNKYFYQKYILTFFKSFESASGYCARVDCALSARAREELHLELEIGTPLFFEVKLYVLEFPVNNR